MTLHTVVGCHTTDTSYSLPCPADVIVYNAAWRILLEHWNCGVLQKVHILCLVKREHRHWTWQANTTAGTPMFGVLQYTGTRFCLALHGQRLPTHRLLRTAADSGLVHSLQANTAIADRHWTPCTEKCVKTRGTKRDLSNADPVEGGSGRAWINEAHGDNESCF
jgi:hypothetical protein